MAPALPTWWEASSDGPDNRALHCHGQLGQLCILPFKQQQRKSCRKASLWPATLRVSFLVAMTKGQTKAAWRWKGVFGWRSENVHICCAREGPGLNVRGGGSNALCSSGSRWKLVLVLSSLLLLFLFVIRSELPVHGNLLLRSRVDVF